MSDQEEVELSTPEILLQEATRSDLVQDLLRSSAISHANFLDQSCTNSRCGGPGSGDAEARNYLLLPKFGSDVKVTVPRNESTNQPERNIHGIFLGVHKKQRRVFAIWTNYERPGEKMKIVLADEIKPADKSTYMEMAEEGMFQAKRVVSNHFVRMLPLPEECKNLKIDANRDEFFSSGGGQLAINLVDLKPEITEILLSDNARNEFLQEINSLRNGN